MKRLVKILLIFVLLILAAAIIYVAYVFISYKRLEDNLPLEVNTPQKENLKHLKINEEYSAITYNMGFGAYLPDYSFFMDGGKYSRAKDRESVIYSTKGVADTVKSYNPDFALFQEMDIDGTRSRHVNQKRIIDEANSDSYNVFALNYDSAFLMYPFHQPHGKNKSGIALYSKYPITSSIRRSLPISTSFSKFVDLDRCYSISRIPVENKKELIFFNLHLSAYTNDKRVREGQLKLLFDDMVYEYKLGNYVICGGDYNYNLKNLPLDEKNDMLWAQQFPKKSLPKAFQFAIDSLSDKEQELMWDSVRNANMPYIKGETFTITVDGFIHSDNVKTTYYENLNTGYSYSDHDPVLFKFKLLD